MTGLPPPAQSSTPPPRVELPSHEQGLQLPVARPAGEVVESRTSAPAGRRQNIAVALLPAALILFLVLAFVAIAWTVVAAGGAAA